MWHSYTTIIRKENYNHSINVFITSVNHSRTSNSDNQSRTSINQSIKSMCIPVGFGGVGRFSVETLSVYPHQKHSDYHPNYLFLNGTGDGI